MCVWSPDEHCREWLAYRQRAGTQQPTAGSSLRPTSTPTRRCSGASLERPGIQALLAASRRRPLPFDILLVDDSSCVSRDLSDPVRLLQELKFAGVRVIYISQNIDNASDTAETLVAVPGVVDSLYLKEMAKKIKRGLAGQLERGFATGSITFGYRTVPVPDPSGKTDVNGYPVLLGKRVGIVAEARTLYIAVRVMPEVRHRPAGGASEPRGASADRAADAAGKKTP